MRQRVMVAMALTCDPELLIADEATTALDVTIQAQILELIQDLKRKLNMSVILVTHNLGIVAGMADRVFVMYNGCIVEKGTVDEIFYNTQHPYTKGLIRSIPRLDQDKNERLYVMSDKDKEKRKDDNSRLGKHVSKGFFMQAWCKVIKNRMFVCTFGIFIVYLLVIFFANFLPIHSYTDQHSVHLNLRPSFQKSGTIVYNREKKLLENMANRQKRSLTSEDHQKLEILKSDLEKDVINERVYILGTDGLGRDMLSRLIYASRVSILVGIVGAVLSVLIGILAGSISGYIGGRLDRFIMASIEILSSLPYMLLVIILMTIFGDHILNIFIAIALISWLVEARLVRGQILSLKNSEFIEAACSMGAGTSTIIFKHLIPNILDIDIVFVTVRIPSFILAESFLSFLGLGISAPLTSWGILIQDGVGSMELYSWQLFFPALVMGIFLFSINFVGDGLRDSFDIRENLS